MNIQHGESKAVSVHRNRLFNILRCPLHPEGGTLHAVEIDESMDEALRCDECGRRFSIIDGIADMVVPGSHAEFMVSEAHQWDEHAVRYDGKRARDAIYLAGVEAAAEALCVQADELILEAGCGTGMVLRRYFRPEVNAVALDLSLDSLRYLRKAMPASRIRSVRGSVDRLPFGNCTFDRILCANTLQHLPTERQRRRALHELARVARPGTRVVVTVHNWSIPKKWAREPKQGAAGSLSGPIQYIHRFDQDEFRTLLASALEVQTVVGAGLPFPYRFKLSPLSRLLERLARKWQASAAWGNMLVGVGYTRVGMLGTTNDECFNRSAENRR